MPATNPYARTGDPLPRLSAAIDRLRALPAGHPFRAVAAAQYTPSDGALPGWLLARPFAIRLLAADAALGHHNPETAMQRRSALCHYLSWLALDDPRNLALPDALDSDEIRRFLASDAARRRTSHRSRSAADSQIRSFRAVAAQLYPASPPRAGRAQTLRPAEDWEVDAALRVIATLRNARTRNQARCWLLLCRGAGLDAADSRYVTGGHVDRRASAGLWVTVIRPHMMRDVPVLARYARELEDLAAGRDDLHLIGGEARPASAGMPTMIGSTVTRALRRAGYQSTLSSERLRKAWLAEQIAANTPLTTLLAAAGLRSLRSLESLIADHAPAAPTASTQLAWELGGAGRMSRRQAG